MQLNDWLKSHGYGAAVGAALNGEFFRFDHGGSLNGFFKGRMVGKHTLAMVGDWKSGDIFYYKSDCPAEESSALDAEFKRLQEEEARLRAERQEDVAAKALNTWVMAIDRGVTPYLTKKGLTKLYGTKICPNYPDTLLVPMRDVQGKLWGLQRILPHKLESGLDKLFPKGGRIKGCFHTIGEIEPQGELYVCEGFSTGASLAECLGKPVACSFNAGNLESVCLALREQFPHAKIIICGDDDRWNTLPDGTPDNPGRKKAIAAATACHGMVAFPLFEPHELEKRLTDFNDLFLSRGAEAVKASFLNPHSEVRIEFRNNEFTLQGISTLDGGSTKAGVPLPPRQQKIVEHILRFLGGHVVKQDRDLFSYVGTHWRLFTLADHDRLKMAVQRVCGGIADVKHVDATYKLLLYHLPTPPASVDMFVPHPFCVNFLNGTLHLLKSGQKFSSEFRPHRDLDYLVHVLPYEYNPQSHEGNGEFLGMLQRVFEGDTDKEEKIRAVRQMYGACLLPAFPRLFMLYGQPGTGKSTVLNVAARLVHKENLCSVPPSEWHGFNMEGMACKLVNIDTDIPINEPIDDDIAKKIIERKPFRIRRKGIKDIMAPIPAIHMFGGNDIPRTLDGASRAHDRRWTFIEFKAFVPKGNYDQEYWDYCFEQSPQGVLNFALEGLNDLLESRGHFLNPSSGKAKMEQWQLSTDPVGQFLVDMREGEVVDNGRMFIFSENAKIERRRLWEGFQSWHEQALNFAPRIGRTKFFDLLRVKKQVEKKIDGVYYFEGILEREVPKGPF